MRYLLVTAFEELGGETNKNRIDPVVSSPALVDLYPTFYYCVGERRAKSGRKKPPSSGEHWR